MGIIEDEIARQNAARTALSGASVSNDGALAARTPPAAPNPLRTAAVSNDGTLGARMNAGPKPVPQPGAPSSVRSALGGASISNDGAIRLAEGQAAQRAAATTAAPSAKAPGTIARAGQMLGRIGTAAIRGNAIAQGGAAAYQALTAQDGVDQAEALVRGGLAAGSVIPQTALVAAPLSMALGVSDALGTTDVVKNQVRQWLNGEQTQKTVPQSSPANVLAQMSPQEQQTLLRDFMAGDKATVKLSAPAKSGSGETFTSLLDRASAQQWMSGPGGQSAARPTAQPTSASPPAARAPGPIQRASGAAPKTVAQQQPVAIEQSGPDQPSYRGVIQAYGGDGRGSGGQSGTQSGTQFVRTMETEAPLNAGPVPPTEIIRGMDRYATGSGAAGAPGSTAEWRTDLPVINTGDARLDRQIGIIQQTAAMQGVDAARLPANLMLGENSNVAHRDVAGIQGETSRAVAGTQAGASMYGADKSAGAHIKGAEISAAAQEYVADARARQAPVVQQVEQEIKDAQGNPIIDKLTGLPATRKGVIQYRPDGQGGGQWTPVESAPAGPPPITRGKAELARLLKEGFGGDRKKYDDFVKRHNIREGN